MMAKKAPRKRLRQTSDLRRAFVNAQGRSEFVIAVFVDVRGFSRFSQQRESPDVAMFIKRFYLQLIDEYFSDARFYKPTGDGLLITFPYDDKTLISVAEKVIGACMRCLSGFPNICDSDPMINFEVPQNIGIGIARGTACCLHDGELIIDYSGHLFNLASRIMELARPSGIVIDAGFHKDVIPSSHRDKFEEAQVYVRSLAETKPIKVFILSDYVRIPEHALSPLVSKQWRTHQKSFTMREMRTLAGWVIINLPWRANTAEKPKVSLRYPTMRKGRPFAGYTTDHNFTHFELTADNERSYLRVDFQPALEILERMKVPRTRNVAFRIQYVAERES